MLRPPVCTQLRQAEADPRRTCQQQPTTATTSPASQHDSSAAPQPEAPPQHQTRTPLSATLDSPLLFPMAHWARSGHLVHSCKRTCSLRTTTQCKPTLWACPLLLQAMHQRTQAPHPGVLPQGTGRTPEPHHLMTKRSRPLQPLCSASPRLRAPLEQQRRHPCPEWAGATQPHSGRR